ncbi:MAG: hypothetical protein QW350_05770 [Candidatus Aenigmatarchaeota archaeon]|jgi:DNA-directed RNA polymerase alpha subunit
MIKIIVKEIVKYRIRLELIATIDPILKVTPLEVANNLRRILLSEIPTVAIDKVIFYKNETYLVDELLEHRIKLVPIFTEDTSIKIFMNVTCSPEEFDICPVMSDYLVPDKKNIKIMGGILLVHLAPGKNLKFECVLKKGTGKEDIRFSPVTIVFFKDIDEQSFNFFFEVIEGYDPLNILEKAVKIFNEKNEHKKIHAFIFK